MQILDLAVSEGFFMSPYLSPASAFLGEYFVSVDQVSRRFRAYVTVKSSTLHDLLGQLGE